MCPAKIQIRRRIRTVWSVFLLGIFWIAKDATSFRADNGDSNQTAQMRSLIWVFVVRSCQEVNCLTLWSKYPGTLTLYHTYILKSNTPIWHTDDILEILTAHANSVDPMSRRILLCLYCLYSSLFEYFELIR